MSVSDILRYPIIASLVGSFLGFLFSCYQNNLQNKKNFRYNQLDKLYGPIYALIEQYFLYRGTVDGIIKNLWKGKCADFSVYKGNNLDDDYEIMAEACVDNAFDCSKKIFEVLTSNIMYIRSIDGPPIQLFFQNYTDYIATFGSMESPPYFSNYFESTKIPEEFIFAIKNGYEELMSQLK